MACSCLTVLRCLNFKLYGPFLWRGFNCLKATESLQGDGLLFTKTPPGDPSIHFIDLGRMKGWAIQWFWTWEPWIGNPTNSDSEIPLGYCYHFYEGSGATEYDLVAQWVKALRSELEGSRLEPHEALGRAKGPNLVTRLPVTLGSNM